MLGEFNAVRNVEERKVLS